MSCHHPESSLCQLAERFSWVPSSYCSPPGCPFPTKSLALSALVSPWTIHFQVLDRAQFWALEGVPLSAIALISLLHGYVILLKVVPCLLPSCFTYIFIYVIDLYYSAKKPICQHCARCYNLLSADDF